ncbi:MAG: D-aminoacyl-tRNA deacylase [Candidatus Magnetoovum sp. WYHC-5]|nr:D-aminoacyl-tRNA deacylase [Candidatus Magnetoovum sp. WYHC-5]
MKALIQRVKRANVTVDNNIIAVIGDGIVVFLCVVKGDSSKDIDYLVKKVSNLRIFEDNAGKMNLSVKDKGFAALIVSQFTLASDCRKGNRPSFDEACTPEVAAEYYRLFIDGIKREGIETKTGIFAANMQVELVNDGPVTFMIDSHF